MLGSTMITAETPPATTPASSASHGEMPSLTTRSPVA